MSLRLPPTASNMSEWVRKAAGAVNDLQVKTDLVAYTVATLPTAGVTGRRAYVTDATAPTFLGALTGGGTVVCPVFDNGSAWVAA